MKISTRFLVFLSVLAVPVWAANPGAPGAINYVEGSAAIDGAPLSPQSVGTAMIAPGQTLNTQHGRVEVLLTPGVFLRVGGNSSLRMVSPGLTDTRVRLLHGQAMLEVTELMKENRLRVSLDGAVAGIQKTGLYAFNADEPQVRVYDGKAAVTEGDSRVELGKGRETALGGALRSEKFNRKEQDPLFAWSDVRSEYLAEASMDSARAIVLQPFGWFGMGWYWNPWWDMYSFIPGNGILYSPFGWGFYAPRYIAYAPRIFYRGRRGTPVIARARPQPPRFAPMMHAPAFRSAPPMHFGGAARGR